MKNTSAKPRRAAAPARPTTTRDRLRAAAEKRAAKSALESPVPQPVALYGANQNDLQRISSTAYTKEIISSSSSPQARQALLDQAPGHLEAAKQKLIADAAAMTKLDDQAQAKQDKYESELAGAERSRPANRVSRVASAELYHDEADAIRVEVAKLRVEHLNLKKVVKSASAWMSSPDKSKIWVQAGTTTPEQTNPTSTTFRSAPLADEYGEPDTTWVIDGEEVPECVLVDEDAAARRENVPIGERTPAGQAGAFDSAEAIGHDTMEGADPLHTADGCRSWAAADGSRMTEHDMMRHFFAERKQAAELAELTNVQPLRTAVAKRQRRTSTPPAAQAAGFNAAHQTPGQASANSLLPVPGHVPRLVHDNTPRPRARNSGITGRRDAVVSETTMAVCTVVADATAAIQEAFFKGGSKATLMKMLCSESDWMELIVPSHLLARMADLTQANTVSLHEAANASVKETVDSIFRLSLNANPQTAYSGQQEDRIMERAEVASDVASALSLLIQGASEHSTLGVPTPKQFETCIMTVMQALGQVTKLLPFWLEGAAWGLGAHVARPQDELFIQQMQRSTFINQLRVRFQSMQNNLTTVRKRHIDFISQRAERLMIQHPQRYGKKSASWEAGLQDSRAPAAVAHGGLANSIAKLIARDLMNEGNMSLQAADVTKFYDEAFTRDMLAESGGAVDIAQVAQAAPQQVYQPYQPNCAGPVAATAHGGAQLQQAVHQLGPVAQPPAFQQQRAPQNVMSNANTHSQGSHLARQANNNGQNQQHQSQQHQHQQHQNQQNLQNAPRPQRPIPQRLMAKARGQDGTGSPPWINIDLLTMLVKELMNCWCCNSPEHKYNGGRHCAREWRQVDAGPQGVQQINYVAPPPPPPMAGGAGVPLQAPSLF